MSKTTRNRIMPSAITEAHPRPLGFDASLQGRSFKAALGDSLFHEHYLDGAPRSLHFLYFDLFIFCT